MKVDNKSPTSPRGAALRSKAQEELDAAGGEKIAAQQAKQVHGAERARYTDAVDARTQLLDEAKKLRLEAADKLRGAVGGRGLFALENVARGFAQMLNKLAGKTFVTVESLKADPEAKATAEKLTQLAAKKEAEAQGQFEVAQRSWAAATEALAKAEGHERTAAAHTEAAAKLMKKAKGADVLAATAEKIGNVAKQGFEVLGGAVKDTVKEVLHEEVRVFSEVAKKEMGKLGDEVRGRAREDLRGLLMVGIDLLKRGIDAFFRVVESVDGGTPTGKGIKAGAALAKKTRRPAAQQGVSDAGHVRDAVKKAAQHMPPAAQADMKKVADALPKVPDVPAASGASTGGTAPEAFSPGKVAFGGAGPRQPVKLTGPRIDAPPRGEKHISEHLLAARWAAEAVGLDWQGKGSGELEKLLEQKGNPLKLSHKDSPFQVMKAMAGRLGLPTGNDAVKALSADTVREQFARREAIGLPRLAPRAELERALQSAGLKPDAGLDELAMYGVAKGSQDVASAAKALKADLNNATAKKAFDAAAAALDASKQVMLNVITSLPAGDRRVLALDACDAVEVAHGKMGATTKLGAALEKLTTNPKFNDYAQRQLGIGPDAFKQATSDAFKASEWISLGELKAPSGVVAFPGPLTDEQRKTVIGPLSKSGTAMAKELGLLDEAGVSALAGHMVFTGKEPAAAQLLGFARQVAALSERRDFRTKELLSKDDIVLEMLRNAGLAPMVGRDGKAFIKQPPSVNPALVAGLGEVIAEVLKSVR